MLATMEEVRSRMTAAWRREAYAVPYRLAGNRYVYAVTDHATHWVPLESRWDGGRQVFELPDDPEPVVERDPWIDAVQTAMQRAMAYFVETRNGAALRRLPRAEVIALNRNWERLGDELNTWLIPSLSRSGVTYQVNGQCTCPDWQNNGVPGGWCKHRLARALAIRAEELLEKERAGNRDGAPDPTAPEGTTSDDQSTTDRGNGQPRRIDLIVEFLADRPGPYPLVSGTGKLVEFKADGRAGEPPSQDMDNLLRWLQNHAYVPTGFTWLGWDGGLRHRRQTYVLQEDHSAALPVEKPRGRFKLFRR